MKTIELLTVTRVRVAASQLAVISLPRLARSLLSNRPIFFRFVHKVSVYDVDQGPHFFFVLISL